MRMGKVLLAILSLSFVTRKKKSDSISSGMKQALLHFIIIVVPITSIQIVIAPNIDRYDYIVLDNEKQRNPIRYIY